MPSIRRTIVGLIRLRSAKTGKNSITNIAYSYMLTKKVSEAMSLIETLSQFTSVQKSIQVDTEQQRKSLTQARVFIYFSSKRT